MLSQTLNAKQKTKVSLESLGLAPSRVHTLVVEQIGSDEEEEPNDDRRDESWESR